MTKTQKILLWVGLALFIIPEILWSPTGNFVNTLSGEPLFGEGSFRPNFLTDSSNINYLSFMLSMQCAGAVLVFGSFASKIRNHKFSFSWFLVSFLLFVWVVFQFLLAGISINVRSIGF